LLRKTLSRCSFLHQHQTKTHLRTLATKQVTQANSIGHKRKKERKKGKKKPIFFFIILLVLPTYYQQRKNVFCLLLFFYAWQSLDGWLGWLAGADKHAL
jgi:hypothetical protein